MKRPVWLRLLLLLAVLVVPAYAHVGNKDVFEQTSIGPYKLFITIRPPVVIPGIATIEVRSTGAAINSLNITPVPMTGEGSKRPPAPDLLKPSKVDPAFYTGFFWLMNPGSWRVSVAIDGAGGPATTSIPVPAMPTAIRRMERPLAILLSILGLILIVGLVCIVDASVGEARLAPGIQPGPDRRRRTVAGAVTLVIVGLMACGYGKWWNVMDAQSAAQIYHASGLHLTLTGNILDLAIGNPDAKQPGGWLARNNADLLPDHGHLMHLYAIRMPEMEAAFHLHPKPVGKQGLRDVLPAMPPGTYKLFADVVFSNGFPETETGTLIVPAGMSTAPLSPEDASAVPSALSAGALGPAYRLPDGYTMMWDKPAGIEAGVEANKAYIFRFTLLDSTGKPATDMQPYLGMAGHAAFVKADGSTFAHTHPDGSAAMPAMMLANPDQNSQTSGMEGMAMPESSQPISPMVEFPYGFPSSGRYRIFIQMKHGTTVETGVFDVEVR